MIDPSSRSPRLSRRLTTVALIALMALPPLSFAPPAAAVNYTDGWGAPGTFTSPSGSFTKAATAAGPDGIVFAVWSDLVNASYSVYGNRYHPNSGWGTAKRLGNTSSGQVAIGADPFGNAFAAWVDSGAYGLNSVIGAFYTVDGGWAPQVNLSSYVKNYIAQFEVAFDGMGNAFVAHRAQNAPMTLYEVVVARAALDGSVDREAIVAGYTTGGNMSIAASSGGGAVLAWDGTNASTSNVYARRWYYGSWSSTQTIDNAATSAFTPDVAVSEYGYGRIVWVQQDQGSFVQNAYFGLRNGYWEFPAAVPNAPATSTFPAIAINDALMGAVAYRVKPGGSAELYASMQLTVGSWTDPRQASVDVANVPFPIQVSMDSTGTAYVAAVTNAAGRNVLMVDQFGHRGFSAYGQATENALPSGNNVSATGLTVKAIDGGHAWAAWAEGGPTARGRINHYSAQDRIEPFVGLYGLEEGLITTSTRVSVQGYAEPLAAVTINGQSIHAEQNGYFSVDVTVPRGSSSLDAEARDAAGNAGHAYLRLTSADPAVPALAESLQAGQAGLRPMVEYDPITFEHLDGPALAADPQGGVWAAFTHRYYPDDHLYLAHYTPGTGWSVPTQLDSQTNPVYGQPSIAVNARGDMLVVWTALDWARTEFDVHAYYQRGDEAWGSTFNALDAVLFPATPQVVAVNDATFLLVWLEPNATYDYHLFSTTIDSPTQNPVVPFDLLQGSVSDVHLASAGDGRAVASMGLSAPASARYVALANFTNGTGWDTARTFARDDGLGLDSTAVAVDAGGNLSLAWYAWNGSANVMHAYRYRQGVGWGPDAWVVGAPPTDGAALVAMPDGSAFLGLNVEAPLGWQPAVRRAAPGAGFGPAVPLNAADYYALCPLDLVGGAGGGPLYVLYRDYTAGPEYELSQRHWDAASGNWSGASRVSDPNELDNVLDAAALADGGFMVALQRYDFFTGSQTYGARHFVPPDATAPTLAVGAPTEGASLTSAKAHVSGVTEPGALVSVNGNAAAVAADGTFAIDLTVANGTTLLTITAADANGNSATQWRNVTFDDPSLRRIDDLEADNARLAADLAAANATLLGALAAQNATLAAMIAETNASLLASLAAQNDDLLASLATTNSALLAQIASQNATLWAKLTDDNGRLWASLNATAANGSNNGGGTGGTASVDSGASTLAFAGIGIALVAVLLAALCISQIRRMNAQAPQAPAKAAEASSTTPAPEAPPPK